MMKPSLITLVATTTIFHLNSLIVTGDVYFRKGSPHVKLPNGGDISGKTRFSRDGRPFNTFLGIPYATVPERFHEPVPVVEPTWQGTLNATMKGASCPQGEVGNASYFGVEDCLNLNVFVPMTTAYRKEALPVMVFIYGGGFMYGDSYEYGPNYFMDEDVILVTFNYRTGVFGFLSLQDENVPGNNGLKDMVVALQWVQRNIGQFGGDPSKVTVFGESAGGTAVHCLLLSQTAKGLFHRAISQSGSCLSPIILDTNPRKNAADLAFYLKCPSTAKDPLDMSTTEIYNCLKNTPLKELNKAQYEFKTSWPLNYRSLHFSVVIEPEAKMSALTPFLSQPPSSIEPWSDRDEIPWIVGITEDEGAAFFAGVLLSNPNLLKEINENWTEVARETFAYTEHLTQEEAGIVSEKVRNFYFGSKSISEETRDSLANLYSDDYFNFGVIKAAVQTSLRRNTSSVYLYQYAYKGPLSVCGASFGVTTEEELNKVGHADEVLHQFVFFDPWDTPGPIQLETIKPGGDDETFSKKFVQLWTTFATYGKPISDMDKVESEWKLLTNNDSAGIVPSSWFRIDKVLSNQPLDSSMKSRLAFWEDIWEQHLFPAILRRYKKASKLTRNDVDV